MNGLRKGVICIKKSRVFLIFLVTAVISLTSFFVIETEANSKFGHILAFVVPAAIMLVGTGLYIEEKRALKKNKAVKEEVESGEFFSSQRWRQSYLNFKTNYTFAKIDSRGMRADLLKNYRAPLTYGYFVFCLTIAVIFLCILLPHPIQRMTNFRFMIFAAGILGTGDALRRLLGIPARRWMKRVRNEYQRIESSYVCGKMIKLETSGINIGSEYIVIYDPSRVRSFRTADIVDAGRKVVRENQYADGVFIQTEQKYKVYFVTKDSSGNKGYYDMELGLFESELVCDEARELLQRLDELPDGFEETVRNDVVT